MAAPVKSGALNIVVGCNDKLYNPQEHHLLMAAPQVRCPTCQREVAWVEESAWRPFCSERCRMVDLGAWFTGGRSIAGQSGDAPGEAEQLPGTNPSH